MKKNVAMLGLAVIAALCMGAALGCAAKEELRESRRPQEPQRVSVSENKNQGYAAAETGAPPAPPAPAPTTAGGEVAGGSEMAGDVAITPEMKACNPNEANQCFLIPRNGCLGCAEDPDGHISVNMQAAKSIMMPRKDQCMAKIQGFKPGADHKGSTDPSCKFNKAVCQPNGTCGLGVMTQEEIQALQKKMEEMQRQRQNGQQGQGMGQPMGQGQRMGG